MKKISTLFIALVAIVSVLSLSHSQDGEEQRMIATINNKKILYKDIRASEKQLKQKLRGNTAPTAEDTTSARREIERQNLLLVVAKYTMPNLLEKLAISVTEKEVREKATSLLMGQTTEAVAKNLRKTYADLVTALKAVYDGSKSEKEAFESYLVGDFSLEVWTGLVTSYRSAERFKALEFMANISAQQVENSYLAAAREALIEEKTAAAIDNLLSVKDQKFADSLNTIKLGGQPQLFDEAERYVNDKRAEWRLDFYKGHVIVTANEFVDLLK